MKRRGPKKEKGSVEVVAVKSVVAVGSGWRLFDVGGGMVSCICMGDRKRRGREKDVRWKRE